MRSFQSFMDRTPDSTKLAGFALIIGLVLGAILGCIGLKGAWALAVLWAIVEFGAGEPFTPRHRVAICFIGISAVVVNVSKFFF